MRDGDGMREGREGGRWNEGREGDGMREGRDGGREMK